MKVTICSHLIQFKKEKRKNIFIMDNWSVSYNLDQTLIVDHSIEVSFIQFLKAWLFKKELNIVCKSNLTVSVI